MSIRVLFHVLLLLFSVSGPGAAEAERPNFLVILADDLGYGDVGFQGGAAKTPHLDKLAAESVRLTAHYVHPMCSPTRAALMTGRYASRFGVTGAQNEQAFPFGTPTLASLLSSAGYDTALIGKWHLGSTPESGPNKFGFAHSYGSLAGGVTSDTHEYKTGPHQRTWHRNGEYLDEPGHVTDLITSEAVRWIETRDQKPFFLYVPYTAVHVPIAAPDRWLQVNRHIGDEAARLRAADVSHLDDGVGLLLAALEKKGLRQNTVVLFLSDNGAHDATDNRQDKYPGAEGRKKLKVRGSNAPFRGWKSGVYDGGIRTPALAHWPGRWERASVEMPVSVTNWLPTLCSLAGVTLPDGPMDGTDMREVLEKRVGEAASWPRPIYSAGPGYRSRMVRAGDWKLVVHEAKGGKGGARELFHLAEDPGETRNVLEQHAAKAVELETLMKKFATDDRARVGQSQAE